MRIRPHNFGYIFLYALCALCSADTLYTIVCQIRGIENAFVSSFSILSYFICIAAVFYTVLYARSQISIQNGELRTVGPVMRKPEDGKRAFFLLRQGNLDMELWDKSFSLADVVRYGYAADLGFPRVDQSDIKEDSRFMPVREVAFVLTDNRRCHVNIGCYSRKQVQLLFDRVLEETHLAPEGSLQSALKRG